MVSKALAALITSATFENLAKASKFLIVGRIKSNSELRWRFKASFGEIQQLATVSPLSCKAT
jgi:hypothetical protein